MAISLWIAALLIGSVAGHAGAARLLTLEQAVAQTLANNPYRQEAASQSALAALEEPRYLSVQDPRLFAHAQYLRDQTAPEIPFQGDRSLSRQWGLGLSQTLVTGTDLSMDWLTRRTDSNASLRPINPAAVSSLTLSVSQALLRDFWGRPDRPIRGQARALAKAAAADLKRLEESLALQTSRDYWRLHAAYKLRAIEQEALADSQKLLEKQKEKRRYGTALETDVLQADAASALYQAELVVVENLIRNLDAALKETMGEKRPPNEELLVPVSSFSSSWLAPSPDQALRLAEQRREDFRAALLRVESAQQALSLARLQILPRLDLAAGFGLTGLDEDNDESWDKAFSGDNPVVKAGLSLTMPLSFRRERLDRRAAEFRLAAEEARLSALRKRLEREVASSWDNWRAARAKHDAFLRLAKAQEAKLSAERREAARGRSSTDQLIRFREDLRAAQRRLAAAQEELAISELSLKYTLGEPVRPGLEP